MRRRAQHGKSATGGQNPAILRIPNDEQSLHIAPRQICTHVEFARISWYLDWLKRSKKREFVADVWSTPPVNKNRRIGPNILILNFRGAQFEEKSGVSIRFDFWLGGDDAGHIC